VTHRAGQRVWTRGAVWLGMILWCTSTLTCAGQIEGAKGELAGLLVDPSGARVVHGTVHIVNEAVGRLDLVRETDNLGTFSAMLPAGRYDVTATARGFAAATELGVRVEEAGHTQVRLRLAIAVQDQSVQVSAENGASTAAAENKTALILGKERLAELSDDPAMMQQQLLAMAGSDPSEPPDTYIDGFSGGQFPPKSSIREIRINQNPFSAEYPSYGRNRMEIFTKPGGDKYHGNFFTIGNDAPFNANNPYTTIEPPYYSYYLDGNLGGPLLDKKTSFFSDFTYHKMQNNSVVDAVNPVGLGALSEAVSAPDNTLTYTLRLDRQITAGNTFTGRYDYRRETATNAGVGLLMLPTEGYNSSNTIQTLQLSDTAVATKIVAETRFEYVRTRAQEDAQNSSPTVLVQGAFIGGGSSIGIEHDNQDQYEFQEYLTIDKSKHFIRTGVKYDLLRDANESTANYNGMFVFPTLAAYQANAPTQFSITTGKASAEVASGWLGAYVEDEWKATKSITVDAGLRYESQSAIPDHADWAPRLGFAWAVGGHGKSGSAIVLRSAFGIFYERFLPANILTSVRQNGTTQQTFFVTNPSFYPELPTASELESGTAPPTPYLISPQLHAEYDEDASVSAERALGKKGNITATYIWARGIHQYSSENVNAPLPGTYDPDVPTSGVRPLGGSQNIYEFVSGGIAKGQLLILSGNMRPTQRLSLFAYYIFQNEHDDFLSPTSFPSNSYDPSLDYARSDRIAKQRLFLGGNLSLPWKVDGNMFVQGGSGLPFNITTGSDLNGDTIYNDRPAFATDLTRPSVVKTPFGNFDTAPIVGQKIIPANYGHSPNFLFVDLSLGKTTMFGHGRLAPAAAGKPASTADKPYSFKVGVEIQNVLNSVNPAPPIGVLSSPLFGKSIALISPYAPLGAANRVVDIILNLSF
jgi:hypothetical protein